MVAEKYKFLRFVAFQELASWAAKNYFSEGMNSKYEIEKIGMHTIHQTKKHKLFNYHDTSFKILGISNEIGMFDAYEEKGANINQPYKKVENGYLAYNPYRINVGSIGLKSGSTSYEYISPAYVVFSCRETLLPEYLYILMRGNIFNKLIRENTTGSVRQTLLYDKLADISVPLPPLETQQKLVTAYTRDITAALENEREAAKLEECIDALLFEELGIEKTGETAVINMEYKFLKFVKFAKLSQWGVEFSAGNTAIVRDKKYRTLPISFLCNVGSGGTPNRDKKEYYTGDIPWIKTGEVVDEVIFDTEEKITKSAINSSSAKVYPKDSLIIAMYGQGKTRGRTAKLGVEASTNQACAVLYNIDNEKILTDFLWFYMQNEYDNIRDLAYGNNQPNLNAQMIKDYPVVIPPLNIQEKITAQIFAIKQQIKERRINAAQLREKAKVDFETEIFNI